jgi:DNA polymerase-3 subunit delta
MELKSINNNLNNIEETLEKISPKIFWKDKPVVTQQLKKWDERKLQKALSEISNTEILMKKNSLIRKDILIKNLIITLCNEAATS